jgi:tetratricopeptide (TPR) repeat protein
LWISADLGNAYTLAGRHDEALPLLAQVVEQAATVSMIGLHSLRLRYLAEACLLAGRWEEARIHAEHALAQAREHGERANEAWALRLLGEIAAAAQPAQVQEAERCYREAVALAEDLGMRPLQAHCHLGLGTLYQRTDRRESAQAALATAAELYRAMDMTLWLARAEAALAIV